MRTLPFWLSISMLSLVQACVVALPRRIRLHGLGRLRRSPLWALLPAGSIAVFVLLVSLASVSAEALSYLALVAVPLLAALALALLGPRRWTAVAAALLFGLAWLDRGGAVGELSAVALEALSCVALGYGLALLSRRRALTLGICAMAVIDTIFVASELLQRPNGVLNAVRPAAGLPQLQVASFGSALLGYGDLFVAGAFGGLLALHYRRSSQFRYAALVALLALAFDLLFFAVSMLPATVPVALASLAAELRRDRTAAALSGGHGDLGAAAGLPQVADRAGEA